MESVESRVRKVAERMDQAELTFGHGTDNALDEAAWLVLHAIGAPLDGSFVDWQVNITPGQADSIDQLLETRLTQRTPLAYLLGEAWFCGLPFTVSPQVLVPRSPIAELIHAGFEPWIKTPSPQWALDLCTGSGCIGIAMASHFPRLQVHAADISAGALDIAAENVRMHGLESRVTLFESDLFDGLPDREYDLIVSNPPYVPVAEVEALPAEYQAEPSVGLVSGTDGLDLPLQIIANSAKFLSDDGWLFCEVGESNERLQAALPDVPFTWLEFSQGGGGVFCINKNDLESSAAVIARALEIR